jgi:hypothetical protein
LTFLGLSRFCSTGVAGIAVGGEAYEAAVRARKLTLLNHPEAMPAACHADPERPVQMEDASAACRRHGRRRQDLRRWK